MNIVLSYFKRLVVMFLVLVNYGILFNFIFGTKGGLISLILFFAGVLVLQVFGPEIVLYFLQARPVEKKSSLGQLWSCVTSYYGKSSIKLYAAEDIPFNIYRLSRFGRGGYFLIGAYQDLFLSSTDFEDLFELALDCEREKLRSFNTTCWIFLLYLPFLPIIWFLPKTYKKIVLNYFIGGLFRPSGKMIHDEYDPSKPVLGKLFFERAYGKSILINHLLMGTKCFNGHREGLTSLLCEEK